MSKNRFKKMLGLSAAILGTGLVIISIVAKKKRPESVYKDNPDQKNPFEGKKVVFVEDETEPENADGIRGHLEAIGDSDHKESVYSKYIKRGLDVILSFGGLVVLSPVLLVISLAIKIDDPGPVLFTQKRLGKNKQYFKLHKFRSMKMSTPHDVPTHQLENPEQYITKVGKFLRAHSLDELPQIWDIFVGNMSVIGPRPGLWNQDLLTAERDKYGANDVKPGLTGWAQINGRDELEIPDKAKLDGEYTEKISLRMDFKCFMRSLHVIGKDESVVEGGTGEMKRNENASNTIDDFLKGNQISLESIKDKKILFFSPAFFNYENMIAEKMREMGAEVDMYDVRSVTGAFDRALLKISPAIFKGKSQNYYEDIIEKNKDKDYDYILIVKCDMTPINILEKFRQVYPNAKLCLNLWDSVENIPGVIDKFKYFDTLHSFDLNDCERYPVLKFRPLFFGDQFREELKGTDDYKYDVGFLGTVHSDRYAVIKQVQEIAEKRGLKCFWFLYLQSKFIYRFYKLTKKEFKAVDESTFSFEKMSSADISHVVDETRIVLDIQHPKQTGLTMRTIEMIGMNKKLITTNESIKKYDFFDENNVAVVDRKNVQIPEEFLRTSYTPLPNDIYEKYSLKSWILEVLS